MIFPLKNQLLWKPKSLPFYFQSIFNQNSIRQLGTKPTHYTRTRDSEDKNSEGNLYLCKSRGQHLLTNPRVLDTIVRKSSIMSADTVLEIGPGTGNLTLRLLEVAKKVFAIEIDKRMVEILRKRVLECGFENKLEIICEDALKTKLPQFDLVVANIPYGISSPLITKLVYGAKPFRSLTLLLQKEFAQRMMANPGDSEYNRLAANVKLVAEVEFVMDVSKRDFLPCPKVDSSVVIIRPKEEIPDVNLDEWRAFTRTCFSNKNKTLAALFKQKKKIIQLFKLSKMKGSFREHGVSSTFIDDDVDDELEESIEESCDPCSYTGMELSLYKEKIIEVMKSNGFEGKRPSKLSNEELLNLLCLFNKAGVFFHG